MLKEILEAKRREVLRLRSEATRMAAGAEEAPAPRDFVASLRGEGTVAVIAEFKRRSPSAGLLSSSADPASVTAAYERGGAAALSVLTDGPYFGGSLGDLHAVRRATALPILRKDFILDPIQLVESRAAGADAVLLIARVLGEELVHMVGRCRELGMSALVEVHDVEELERALEADAEVVGVNARNLNTFEVDFAEALRVVARVPADRVAVAESGISGPEDLVAAGRAGADAVLVGSWLMASEPEAAVASLTGQPRRPRPPTGTEPSSREQASRKTV